MYFKQLISKYITGNIPTGEMAEFAYIGMKEGYDSPSLHILAGLEDIEDSYEADKCFKLTLNELGLIIPDNRQAALQYAAALAEQIINDKADVYHGVYEIINTAIGKYDFNSENKQHVYDSIFFDEVYGIYHTYEDLLAAKVDWVKDKSNEELMIEVKKELFEALIVWNDKIKDLIV
ncbi:hypothetical protein [Mucilaginibacter sp. L196]|uniref:hypothetical protein n=1 Tax=Mucilaginibacter sp. L196 TaxID=1641870 RepID=UPI00131B0160|nr:hypothetical protein [Mucilaginibacter sp. L196]